MPFLRRCPGVDRRQASYYFSQMRRRVNSCKTRAEFKDLNCLGRRCVDLALAQVSVAGWRTMRAEGIAER